MTSPTMRQPSRLIMAATICMLLFAGPASAAELSQAASPTERITLNVKDRPLGEVLAAIGRTTGYAFILDESWQGHPVTAYLTDASLHTGLKRILSGLNHAIVYLPGNRIKIQIIEASSPGPASSGKPMGSPASRPLQSPGPAPAPPPPELPSKPPDGDSPESSDSEPEQPEPESGDQAAEENPKD